jgi:hypothetical protein
MKVAAMILVGLYVVTMLGASRLYPSPDFWGVAGLSGAVYLLPAVSLLLWAQRRR